MIAGATCLYSPPIASQADADQFTICPTVTGDITIATDVVGNIKIDGPKVIAGNLVSAQCLPPLSLDAGLGNATGGTIHMEGMSALQNLTGLTFTQIDYFSLQQTGPLTHLPLLVEETLELFSVGGDGNLNLDVSALKSTSSLTIFGCSQVNLAAFTTCANVDFKHSTFFP
jgi:hypothetical protein